MLAAPSGFVEALRGLPAGTQVLRSARGPIDVAVLFVTRRTELLRRFPTATRAMRAGGGLWVAWPKRSSGVVTDLREAEIREIGLAHGLVDSKHAAIDDLWSGIRFAPRNFEA